MRTIRRKLKNVTLKYPLEQIAELSNVLFMDIETTGFAAKSSVLYLIGCAYYENGVWHTIQWFATNYQDEKAVVEAFFKFAEGFTHLIHFNGNNFDLPFILQKCRQYGLTYRFDFLKGIDIYKRISPCRHFLKLSNCKQKTLEQFLGVDRQDLLSGGELIGLYHDFVKNQTDYAYDSILCHNSDDLKGMLCILPILAYSDLFTQALRVKKVQANYYRDLDGSRHQELFMKLRFPAPLPKAVSCAAGNCYFTGEDMSGALRVPLYEEEMKYFYSNYKDYYYLPLEDVAIHKAVATFVDRDHRIQATASNCYTRKISSYLPQWNLLFEPFFKRDYKSKELFFELTEEFKTDRDAFQAYAAHILQMMSSSC